MALALKCEGSLKLFLFDDPLSNPDAELRVKTCLEIARQQRALASAMIYMTHDQTEQ